MQLSKLPLISIIFLFSCKEKVQTISINTTNLIGKELKIDKYDFTYDKFRSKILLNIRNLS